MVDTYALLHSRIHLDSCKLLIGRPCKASILVGKLVLVWISISWVHIDAVLGSSILNSESLETVPLVVTFILLWEGLGTSFLLGWAAWSQTKINGNLFGSIDLICEYFQTCDRQNAIFSCHNFNFDRLSVDTLFKLFSVWINTIYVDLLVYFDVFGDRCTKGISNVNWGSWQ